MFFAQIGEIIISPLRGLKSYSVNNDLLTLNLGRCAPSKCSCPRKIRVSPRPFVFKEAKRHCMYPFFPIKIESIYWECCRPLSGLPHLISGNTPSNARDKNPSLQVTAICALLRRNLRRTSETIWGILTLDTS